MSDTPDRFPNSVAFPVFFASGLAAVVYQILWQRAVFTMFGSDNESVTIIVSAFMLGLGIGSLVGGWASRRFPDRLIYLFAGVEAAIGLFGLASLSFFALLREVVLYSSTLTIHVVSFLGVAGPATLMGATLPLLVAHLVRYTKNVGDSVGVLYYVNTLGSGIGCLVAVGFLFREFGMTGSIRAAAALNLLAAVAVIATDLALKRKS